MFKIPEIIQNAAQEIAERRALRELFDVSPILLVRLYSEHGSTVGRIPPSLLGFDGFYGPFLDAQGKLDVIGCDEERHVIGTVRLGR